MKKLMAVLLVIAAATGLYVYRKAQAGRAEQDLWTEATRPVDLT